MNVLLSNFICLFAEAANAGNSGSAWDKFLYFWETYINYPGFEAWRFFNLLIFGLILAYLLRRPLSNAFKEKRETIREDLIRAEEERQAAITELTEVEAQLAQLDSEVARLSAEASEEAASEKARIAEDTESAVLRMKQQADTELSRKTQIAKLQLRKYSAEESIRIAEEKIRSVMNVSKDAELVKANIESIGGAR
ncbi:MAG: hypothetical protein ACK5NT_05390 [Pyrinomonadaceae bacterium]